MLLFSFLLFFCFRNRLGSGFKHIKHNKRAAVSGCRGDGYKLMSRFQGVVDCRDLVSGVYGLKDNKSLAGFIAKQNAWFTGGSRGSRRFFRKAFVYTSSKTSVSTTVVSAAAVPACVAGANAFPGTPASWVFITAAFGGLVTGFISVLIPIRSQVYLADYGFSAKDVKNNASFCGNVLF